MASDIPHHKRIWLQPFAGDCGGHTWCQDRIENDDIEYVRLDVHQAALVEAKALGAEEMKERAMNAVREEQLSGDSDDDTDRAYERAINDALGAIRNLEAKDAG